ncbi:MAG: SUF system Fe-S cluster assembly protein [Ignavibacteriae bacterium]|jgi:FeS assembly SUF system protein|nr:SUF system Fe-S cluster assembly protein [Ignavibacteriota bacterium]NOG97678.1 SUF system Fe-S cluster assembly protein [Ignavibacteriota bacterium]
MIDIQKMETDIVDMLKTVFDPEIPVDIYELGLIYEIKIDEDANVYLKMTLTSPACPVAGTLPGEVEQKVKNVSGVNEVYVDLVWDPAWDKDMMSEEAKLTLGLF